jgi:hypothetical protein
MYFPLDAAAPVTGHRSCMLVRMGHDQLMTEHKAKHVQVGNAPGAETPTQAATVKVALFDALGIVEHMCDGAIARGRL